MPRSLECFGQSSSLPIRYAVSQVIISARKIFFFFGISDGGNLDTKPPNPWHLAKSPSVLDFSAELKDASKLVLYDWPHDIFVLLISALNSLPHSRQNDAHLVRLAVTTHRHHQYHDKVNQQMGDDAELLQRVDLGIWDHAPPRSRCYAHPKGPFVDTPWSSPAPSGNKLASIGGAIRAIVSN